MKFALGEAVKLFSLTLHQQWKQVSCFLLSINSIVVTSKCELTALGSCTK